MILSRAELLTYLGIAGSATNADIGLLELVHPKAEATIKTFLQNDIEYQQHIEYLPSRDRFEQRDNFVDVQLSATTVTLVPGARYNRILQVKHVPIWLASLEIREDHGAYAGQATGAFGASTVLVNGVDYYLDVNENLADIESGDGGDISRTGHLTRVGNWSTIARSIKVTYYGGWKAVHLDATVADIKGAVLEMVTRAYALPKARGRRLGPVVSESLGKTSTTYSEAIIRAAMMLVSSVPLDVLHKLQNYRHYGRPG